MGVLTTDHGTLPIGSHHSSGGSSEDQTLFPQGPDRALRPVTRRHRRPDRRVGIRLAGAVSASPQHYSASQLSDVRAAVLQSGVEGIAWYVDNTADRVVVAADGSVSGAEIATIKEPRATTPVLSRSSAWPVSSPRCSPPVMPFTAASTVAHSVSTSSTAAPTTSSLPGTVETWPAPGTPTPATTF